MSKKTITWHAWQMRNWPKTHPVRSWLRDQAKQQGYVGIPGIDEFLQITYGARAIQGKNHDWNGVRFPNETALQQFWCLVPDHVKQACESKHMGETNA